MSRKAQELLRAHILRAKEALNYAEEALLKGHVATCSYELEAAVAPLKAARLGTAQEMRQRIAATEKEAA